MTRAVFLRAVLAGCLALGVAGCDWLKSDDEKAAQAVAEIQADPTLAPAMRPTVDAVPYVEKIAAMALLSAGAGGLNASEIDSRFDQAVARLANEPLNRSDLDGAYDRLIDEYIAYVTSRAANQAQWPPDYPAETWVKMAAIRLQMARNDIQAARSQGQVPVEALRAANTVLAWSAGSRTITPEFDHFGRYDDLVQRGIKALNGSGAAADVEDPGEEF